MPSLFFDTSEIIETGTATVDKRSGYAYIGRKHGDQEIVWIKLKKRG